MTYSEIGLLAREFNRNKSLSYRKEIIRNIWKSGGRDGLIILGDMIGLTYGYLYRLGNMDQYFKHRSMARRGRYRFTEKNEHRYEGLREAAIEAAAGGTVFSGGGKRTKSNCGQGSLKSVSLAQSWQALAGN